MATVLFRCDASPAIGAGHVMRCIALAEAFAADGWTVCFATRSDNFAAAPALKTTGFRVLELSDADDVEAIRSFTGQIDLMIVDHYDLDKSFESACRAFARKILVMDDVAKRQHDCDFIVDSSQDKSSAKYDDVVNADCQRLFGPDYALIRAQIRAFRSNALNKRREGDIRNIFVSFGAMDIGRASAFALKALASLKKQYEVLVAMNSNAPSASSIAAAYPDATLLLDTADIGEAMLNCDIAIGAAGATAWERCHLALPSVMLTTADNQISIAQMIDRKMAGIYAGASDACSVADLARVLDNLIADAGQRASMSQHAAALVDGLGAQRIVKACSA